MSPDSILSVTPNVFWYGEKGTFEITLYSFKTDYITDEVA